MDMQHRHVRAIQANEILRLLPKSLEEARTEMKTLANWYRVFVMPGVLEKWIDGPLKDAWGVKAAARVCLICRRGEDGEPSRRYEKSFSPSSLPMIATKKVPGAPTPANSLFDVSQALAWVAKERNEVEERIQWRAEIPGLLEALK